MNKKIENIVISGGGLTLFTYYGILKESSKSNIWNINSIKTIYGTSAGAILSVLLCLNYDWETLDNYIINRPWEKVFNIDMYLLFDTINRKGIFNISVIKEVFKPLFSGKDIDIDINFIDFYNLTNIELHLFVTDINTFKHIDVSYKTHPTWKIIDIIYSSSAVPIIFAPFTIDEYCLLDGGVFTNCPITYCINNDINPESILCITHNEDNINKMDGNANLLDYIIILLSNLIKTVNKNIIDEEVGIKYISEFVPISIDYIFDTITKKETRISLIEKGEQIVKLF
tara:strand:- start:5113 stop:5967 length:855 start_codon:yes stop_codon:yes gene_type:complete